MFIHLFLGCFIAFALDGDEEEGGEKKASVAAVLDETYSVDYITLYYHDDPINLMETITGTNATKVGSREEIALTSYNVDRLGLNITLLEGKITSAQTEQRQLEARLSPAVSANRNAAERLYAADRTFQRAKLQKSLTETDHTKVKANAALSTATDEDRRALVFANDALHRAEREEAQAQLERDLAQSDLDRTTTVLAQLKSSVGLTEEKIQQIRDNLTRDRKELADARALFLVGARQEALIFGQFRDQGHLYTSTVNIKTAEGKSVPVYLGALPDSRSIVVAGPAKQVGYVASIIEKFDRPQPQAMLTLWTMELSSQATDDGAHETDKALRHINQHLRKARSRIDESVAKSRDLLLNQLNPTANPRERRAQFYDENFLKLFGYYGSGDAAVLDLLPDPGRASSLAEVITIGVLAKPDIYTKIFPTPPPGAEPIRQDGRRSWAREEEAPAATGGLLLWAPARILGTTQARPLTGIGFVGMRYEFGLAVRSWILRREYRKVKDILELYSAWAIELGDLTDKIFSATTTEERESLKTLRSTRSAAIARLVQINQVGLQASLTAIEGMKPGLGLNDLVQELDQGFIKKKKQDDPISALTIRKIQTAIAKIDSKLDRTSPEGLFIGQEATVNEFLKKLVFSTEDVVQEYTIEPMYRELSKDLREMDGISVGILQRTSILASNRLIARVDPKGSASIELTKEQDILGAALQLQTILADAQTGGVFSAARAQLQREEESPKKAEEIYGLTTGNRFQVRPILDPTGQALRFRFDHISETIVRDPDSTSNPLLNRIERHTANTEVQLSNFEIREVSRFQSNAKLGLPEKRFGGIPILNEIPGIREIPIIGWFSRQWGEAAQVQSSLILAQTNIYPTIDFILRRLTEGN
ncbi:MAG: hypothetical protein KIS61_21265 [Candidatus Eremiobacteraeota bacterium]|nr:hypothetical protein [Candidatus Eremiobacteraeota bacterium]